MSFSRKSPPSSSTSIDPSAAWRDISSSTAQCSTVQYTTVQHRTVQHNTGWAKGYAIHHFTDILGTSQQAKDDTHTRGSSTVEHRCWLYARCVCVCGGGGDAGRQLDMPYAVLCYAVLCCAEASLPLPPPPHPLLLPSLLLKETPQSDCKAQQHNTQHINTQVISAQHVKMWHHIICCMHSAGHQTH